MQIWNYISYTSGSGDQGAEKEESYSYQSEPKRECSFSHVNDYKAYKSRLKVNLHHGPIGSPGDATLTFWTSEFLSVKWRKYHCPFKIVGMKRWYKICQAQWLALGSIITVLSSRTWSFLLKGSQQREGCKRSAHLILFWEEIEESLLPIKVQSNN